MEQFLAGENLPFSIALALMAFIAALECVGLLMGMAPSEAVDSLLPDIEMPDVDGPDIEMPDATSGGVMADVEMPEAGIHEGGFFTKILGWMSFGQVPALIWLVVFLGGFGLSGLTVQTIMDGVAGFYLPAWMASVPAFFVTMPVTRTLGRGLAKILPKDETEAVSRDDFIGRTVTIFRGVAKRGEPAEAKLTDQHGLTHYVLVEPDLEGEALTAEDNLIIVKKQGMLFHVIKTQSSALNT